MKIRVGIQQRVIPTYRAPFLELLAKDPEIDLGVIAGEPRPMERISIVHQLAGAEYSLIENQHFLNGKFYFCIQPRLKDWVLKWQPDILIVEANPRYLSTPEAIKWMKKKGKPVIGWGLGVPQNSGILSFFRNNSRRQFLNSFTAMIAYSQKGAQQYINAGFSSENVYVAMNATASAPKGPPPLRPIWDHEYIPVLLYVGRLQARKKLDVLIAACSQLPEKIQPNLWIVGEGPIKNDLVNLARKVYPRTQFWGEKFGDDLSRIFLKADLFVLPGTGGLAVQQAMAHALPVIVAEGDGTQSDLVSTSSGWNIKPDDQRELIDTIKSALEDPMVLRQKGLNAYQTVQLKVNIEQMVAVFKQACFETLSRVKP